MVQHPSQSQPKTTPDVCHVRQNVTCTNKIATDQTPHLVHCVAVVRSWCFVLFAFEWSAVSSLVVHKCLWSSNYVSNCIFTLRKCILKCNWSSTNVCGRPMNWPQYSKKINFLPELESNVSLKWWKSDSDSDSGVGVITPLMGTDIWDVKVITISSAVSVGKKDYLLWLVRASPSSSILHGQVEQGVGKNNKFGHLLVVAQLIHRQTSAAQQRLPCSFFHCLASMLRERHLRGGFHEIDVALSAEKMRWMDWAALGPAKCQSELTRSRSAPATHDAPRFYLRLRTLLKARTTRSLVYKGWPIRDGFGD